jgi:heptose-I-phosphate ethanolaminephosphotransferase
MNNYYRHIDVFKVAQPFVFLFSSFIGVYLSELAVFEYDPTRLVNLVENIAFSSLLFSIMVLIFNQYAIKIFKYIFLLLLVFTILEGVYFLIFRAEFTSSAIFIGLDTNTREIGEFVQFNLANTHLFFAFGVMISFYLSWYFFKPKLPTMSSFRRLFMLFVASLGIFIMSTTKVQNYNVFFAIVNSVLDYNKQRNQFQNLELVQNPFSEVTQLSDSIKTHVIVIGESTSKLHFGLYGYERNTTPMLSEIKGELKLFSDVVSGDTNTIGSLMEALVIKKENKLIGNVIQLFKQAGFKTYWLSNQPPIGMYETLVTKIGISADDVRFLNS